MTELSMLACMQVAKTGASLSAVHADDPPFLRLHRRQREERDWKGPFVLLVRMALRSSIEELYRTLRRQAPLSYEDIEQTLLQSEQMFQGLEIHGFEVEASDRDLFAKLHQCLRTTRGLSSDVTSAELDDGYVEFFATIEDVLATVQLTLALGRQVQRYIDMFEVPFPTSTESSSPFRLRAAS